jgi:hypothetical protein
MLCYVAMQITTYSLVTEQFEDGGFYINRCTGDEWRISERGQSWVTDLCIGFSFSLLHNCYLAPFHKFLIRTTPVDCL